MRTTRVLSVTLPVPMLEETQALARQENRTMSELVREALRSYQRQRLMQSRWDELSARGEGLAERAGVLNEDDVVAAVHDYRHGRA